MARIAGVDIPREKRLVIALTYIYGIGDSTAEELCQVTGIDGSTRVRDLSDPEVADLRTKIDEWSNDPEREFFFVEETFAVKSRRKSSARLR